MTTRPKCQAGVERNIRIENGQFKWGGERITIVGDGNFNGQSGVRFLQGKVEGNQMKAQIYAPGCDYTWAFTR